MKIAGKTVCVTGAAGFLGSALCCRLVETDVNVIALDNFSVGRRDTLEAVSGKMEIFSADIRDTESLREPLAKSQIVVHLAAIDNRKTCEKDFNTAFDVNTRGTANVLSVCTDVERVVYMSSTMVYGEPRYLPIDEEHPLDGYDPYAVSKIDAEHLFRAYRYLQDMPFTIIRNSNTFGPGQNRDYLVPSLIIEGLTKERIEVWTPGVIRDFQWVDDCIDAIIMILESESTLGETLNLGSGRGITTGELADIICEYLGISWIDMKKPPPVSTKLISDVTKIKTLTGWEPKVNLENGLHRLIDYYKTVI